MQGHLYLDKPSFATAVRNFVLPHGKLVGDIDYLGILTEFSPPATRSDCDRYTHLTAGLYRFSTRLCVGEPQKGPFRRYQETINLGESHTLEEGLRDERVRGVYAALQVALSDRVDLTLDGGRIKLGSPQIITPRIREPEKPLDRKKGLALFAAWHQAHPS